MDEPLNVKNDNGKVVDPYFVSLSDALKAADDEFDLVFGNKTRGSRELTSIE